MSRIEARKVRLMTGPVPTPQSTLYTRIDNNGDHAYYCHGVPRTHHLTRDTAILHVSAANDSSFWIYEICVIFSGRNAFPNDVYIWTECIYLFGVTEV